MKWHGRRGREDASKLHERQLRNSKVEGKTWAIGSTERGVLEIRTSKGRKLTAKRRARERLSLNRSERLEMTRHGRKDPGRREGSTWKKGTGRRNQFRIKVPTMDLPLCLRFFPCSSFYVNYIECHRVLNAFHTMIEVKEAKRRKTSSVLMARHWWFSNNKLLKIKFLSRYKLQQCKLRTIF